MRTVPGQPHRLDARSRLAQRAYRAMRAFPWAPSAERYNLTVSHTQKFVWFRVAKVGTRSILHHLRQSEVPLELEHPSFVHYPPRAFTRYFKFAFVRNPWDRLVSTWLNKVVSNNHFGFAPAQHARLQAFSAFVDYVGTLDIERCDRHLRSQAALIDLNHLDYLGRMERFDTDLRCVFDTLSLAWHDLAPQNVSAERSPYAAYYSTDLAAQVARIYRKDIQLFGYHFA